MGYNACRQASATEGRQGNVGAGTGAAIGRLIGNARGMVKGGLGTASIRVGDLVVGAIVAVNCNGDVTDPVTGEVLAGTLTPEGDRVAGAMRLVTGSVKGYKGGFPTNTTMGVVATNARLTKALATHVSIMTHDGYARAINPLHTLGDGDVVFTLATCAVAADPDRVGALAANGDGGSRRECRARCKESPGRPVVTGPPRAAGPAREIEGCRRTRGAPFGAPLFTI